MQVTAKQATFRGLTHYYQAKVCNENKAVGEEIARLQVNMYNNKNLFKSYCVTYKMLICIIFLNWYSAF